MKSSKLKYIIFLLCSTFLGALGQFFFKGAFDSTGLFAELLAIGLISYIFSTVFYFYVLSRTHLSWAYSIGGLSYIFAVLLARFALSESVPPLRWVGVLVITVGVVLIGLS
jgi:drug/metabolite transporter (DMT)-like permease